MFGLYFYPLILFLLVLSYLDLRHQKVNNWLIGLLFIIVAVISIISGNMLSLAIIVPIMTFLSYGLWKKMNFGGADSKLLIALSPAFTFYGAGTMVALFFIFLATLVICTVPYVVMYNKLFNDREEIPFIPIITLSFILTLFYL